MAGDWIKIRVGITKEPEVIAIAADLDVCEHTVVGWLVELWGWADSHLVPLDSERSRNAASVTFVTHLVTETERPCFAPRVTESFLDRLVGKNGFAKALASVGWLEILEGGILFPKFGRHNSKTAKQRALAANRKRAHDAKVTPPERKSNAPSVTEVTQEERAERYKSVHRIRVREDGRREEEDGEPIRIGSLAKTAETPVSAAASSGQGESDQRDPPEQRPNAPVSPQEPLPGDARGENATESPESDCGQFAGQVPPQGRSAKENRSQGPSRERSERMVPATEWSEWVSVWNGAAAPVGISSVQHRQTKLSEQTRRRLRAYEPDADKRRAILHEIAAELERSAPGIVAIGGGGWFSLHWLFERQGANCEKFLGGQYRRGDGEEAASAARQRAALEYVRRAETEERCAVTANDSRG